MVAFASWRALARARRRQGREVGWTLHRPAGYKGGRLADSVGSDRPISVCPEELDTTSDRRKAARQFLMEGPQGNVGVQLMWRR